MMTRVMSLVAWAWERKVVAEAVLLTRLHDELSRADMPKEKKDAIMTEGARQLFEAVRQFEAEMSK